tara:strand:- start:789 stop:1079 length:291 start_codon:yes stop_codon:yes gene_type:complete
MISLFTKGTINLGYSNPIPMSPHKGPQIIRYCVVTSTIALVAIAVSMIPQFKVNRGKILCANYFSILSTDQEQEKLELKLQKFFGFRDIVTYCQNL